MTNTMIALLFAVGGGAWAYAKIQRITGGNTQTSITMAAIAAVILFLVMFIILGFIPQN